MANEFTISAALKYATSDVTINTSPTNFRDSQTTNKGPGPGLVTATTTGVNVDLSQFTLPGNVVFKNKDATNFVTIGLYESSGTIFRPFAELKPGASCVFRFSRSVLTANTAADVIRLKADTASCIVDVKCFDA